MAKVGSWSTTPASNNSAPPDGWPEGQAPSTVNDCAREMMAQIRTMINDLSFIDLNHVPTRTGATTFTIPGNVASFYDIGRRVKAFDASTLYGTVISSTFTTNTGITLRLDSGVLTNSMTSVAVSVLGNNNQAIPDSVARVENILINGQLEVWQEGTSFNISGSAATTYLADCFAIFNNSGASLNINQLQRSASASNVPSLAQTGILLNNSIQISVSATDASLAGSDYCYISTCLEGYNWRQIAHKPFVYSFWVHTNRTGTYCLSFRNNGVDQSYVKEFQISAANTWEKKTFVVPEAPTGGTWSYSQSVGLECQVVLACGATFQATDGAWTAMNALATSNQTNFLASAGHTIRFADFRLTEGTQIMQLKPRLMQQELDLCKRYYQKSYDYSTAPGTVTALGRYGFNAISVGPNILTGRVFFQTTMPFPPVITLYSPVTGTADRAFGGADYTASAAEVCDSGFSPTNTSAATQPALLAHWVAKYRLR